MVPVAQPYISQVAKGGREVFLGGSSILCFGSAVSFLLAPLAFGGVGGVGRRAKFHACPDTETQNPGHRVMCTCVHGIARVIHPP